MAEVDSNGVEQVVELVCRVTVGKDRLMSERNAYAAMPAVTPRRHNWKESRWYNGSG